VVPSLFELMAQQVMQQWSSRELLASGVMTDFMLEELYASAGKVRGPCSWLSSCCTLPSSSQHDVCPRVCRHVHLGTAIFMHASGR
jgi:hypothetical protein